jgi:hypothetical protein
MLDLRAAIAIVLILIGGEFILRVLGGLLDRRGRFIVRDALLATTLIAIGVFLLITAYEIHWLRN